MLSLERFAELRAAIERAGDRDQVLRDEKLGKKEWIALQRRWLDAMAAEVAAGKSELASRYQAAFERGLAGESASPEPEAVVPEDAGSPSPPGERPALAASYMQRDAAFSQMAPFVPEPLSPVAEPPNAEPPKKAATRAFAMPPSEPSVPFKPGDSETGLQNALKHAEETAPESKPQATPIGMTEDVDIAAIVRKVAPFAQFGAQKPPSPSPPQGPGQAQSAPSAAAIPEISVQQYAWFQANLRKAKGADTSAVLAQFNLTPESARALEDTWRDRMARDEGLRNAFLAALQHYMSGLAP